MVILLESVCIKFILKKYFRLFIFFLGPNEFSICNIEAVIPLMGPHGLEKGPCKFTSFILYFLFILNRYILCSLVWASSVT
jgi:hypothetical protein